MKLNIDSNTSSIDMAGVKTVTECHYVTVGFQQSDNEASQLTISSDSVVIIPAEESGLISDVAVMIDLSSYDGTHLATSVEATTNPPNEDYAYSHISSTGKARPESSKLLSTSSLASSSEALVSSSSSSPTTPSLQQDHSLSLITSPAITNRRPPPRLWDEFDGNVTSLMVTLGQGDNITAGLYVLVMLLFALGVRTYPSDDAGPCSRLGDGVVDWGVCGVGGRGVVGYWLGWDGWSLKRCQECAWR